MVACAEDVRKRVEGQGGKEAAALVEEQDSDEEQGDEEGLGKQFVWDSVKCQLVEASAAKAVPTKVVSEGTIKVKVVESVDETAQEPKAGALEDKEGADGADVEEDDDADDDEESSEADEEAVSRHAFLNDASTPELIKQAIAVGGIMADSVRDRWVLDQTTQLHFRYDSRARHIQCWNPEQGCMYHWKERGKMDFLWASPAGPSPTPPSAAPPPAGVATGPFATAVRAVGSSAEAREAPPQTLRVTIIPPDVLIPGGLKGGAKVVEEIELSAKALAGVIGKGGASIREIQKRSGVKATTLDPREGETVRCLRLEGTKAQISEAKHMLEQKVILTIGEKAAEKMQKHMNTRILERKRAETGSAAAKEGVPGLSEFCDKWAIKAVMARKIARLDAQLQRYMMRHFKPLKAKPINALRGYIVALLKHPQRWRLEALYEDGELDGEVCETIAMAEGGAVIGRQRTGGEQAEPLEVGEQLIELEVDASKGEQATRIYGDVQPQHCRLLRVGNNFYAWALESQIGTVVDGQKCRQSDGPVPVRDGSIVGVGKYLLYCEIGTADALQQRRKQMLEGERLWKAGRDAGVLAAAQEVSGGEAAAARGTALEAAAVREEVAVEGKDGEDGEGGGGAAEVGEAAEAGGAAEPAAGAVEEEEDGELCEAAGGGGETGKAGRGKKGKKRKRPGGKGGAADQESAGAPPAKAGARLSSAAAMAAAWEAAQAEKEAAAESQQAAAVGPDTAAAAPVEAAAATDAAPPDAAGPGTAEADEMDEAGEREDEEEEPDPMQEMLRELGLPSGFGAG